jgi:hypothetical protein
MQFGVVYAGTKKRTLYMNKALAGMTIIKD